LTHTEPLLLLLLLPASVGMPCKPRTASRSAGAELPPCHSSSSLSFNALQVRGYRSAELSALALRKYLDALCVYFWAATQLLLSGTTFGLMVLLGQPLRCDRVLELDMISRRHTDYLGRQI
jgi:hypothetical protein